MNKYDAKTIETNAKQLWEKEAIFEFDVNSDKPLYIVDTPPPYVSADHLHAGHIMSYAQAEFIVRYKRMRGFNVYYPMGFDDNGLPTERFVEKKYNIDKSKITRSEFIKICLKETEIGSATYKQLWNDLGISVDWTKTYSTISPLAAKVSQKSILDINKKDGLYRQAEPILWCVQCQTALAQADLEDEDIAGHLNYIEFAPDITIATTRPELLGACVALYINPNDSAHQHLIGKEVEVPLFGYKVAIKTSEQVDPKFGTGIIMVCTWGDQEDVDKWRTDNLDKRPLFTEDGHITELGNAYAGLSIPEARATVISDLQSQGFLKKQEPVKRPVNVHERCSTPVEFILTKQWFIKVAGLKDKWLEYGKKLDWYPETRRNDYELWVQGLKWDWCISRQRFYGVPLPIWYCADCQEPVFADEKDLPVNPLEDKPPTDTCHKCGCKNFTPEEDVLDTWATSSCTPLIIKELLGDTAELSVYPATLRPNAFEIIRTWDFYTIVKSHYHFGDTPFKDVMISGHGLDEEGRKFSKRLGNYVPASELVEQYGADPIRYWATGALLGQNLRFSTKEVDMGHKTAMKLWNVARFVQMSAADGDSNEQPAYEHADAWIIDELNAAIEGATKAFDAYSYAKARDIINGFFWSKFTDYYLEFIKYRLFGDDAASKAAASDTVKRVFLAILKMYAPIIPFITEELYQTIYQDEPATSIHVAAWPEKIELGQQLDIADFDTAIAAVDEIRKYKSEQGMPLGKELDEYKLQLSLDHDKYGNFVAKAIRVTKLVE
jgi:valyl-tRNA synthetase